MFRSKNSDIRERLKDTNTAERIQGYQPVEVEKSFEKNRKRLPSAIYFLLPIRGIRRLGTAKTILECVGTSLNDLTLQCLW
jgi:hypothetical protein